MAKLKEFLSRIRFVRRPTSNITKIIVIVAIVLCMTTLVALRLSTVALEERTEDLRHKAGQLEEANSVLEQKIDEVGTVKSIVEIAKEKLGLVEPNAVIIQTEP